MCTPSRSSGPRLLFGGIRNGRIFCFAVAAFAVISLIFVTPSGAQSKGHTTALDRYVHAEDPSYHYSLEKQVPGEGYTAYLLSMTSQSWRTPSEVDRTLWRHWLTVYKPSTVGSSTGLLFITGGDNDGKEPELDKSLAAIATTTGSVVAELRMVPNQPLTFPNDPHGPREEDAIIAYTWDKYLKTGDETWPLRLPMTKSAVRAMDAVTAFLASDKGGGAKIDRFVVSGASKRGWTTWATAAVDSRVVAIIPIVIDMLNLEKSFRHHYRVYGFWAPAVKDYFDMGLMDKMADPKYHELMKIEEPYEYRDRFTMPKFIVNSAGDQFFLPDSSRFYFDDLPSEKYLRYVPNSDHSLRDTDAVESITAYYQAVLTGTPRPQFGWKFEKDGSIRVTTKDKPEAVKVWQATNREHRDFRLESVGPIYKSSDLAPARQGAYIAKVPKPEKGWTAFFVELTYPGKGKFPFKFTTGIRITPDTEPFLAPEPGKTKIGTQPPGQQ